MNTYVQLPVHAREYLATLDEPQLIELMIGEEDRVSREVIDECVRRGAAMERALSVLVSEESDWQMQNKESGRWWLRLHAIMILGLMTGQVAGVLLLRFMRRMDVEGDDNRQDWCAGHWPALFANKPREVTDELKEFAEDPRLSFWIRHEASDARVCWFRQQGGESLEDALRWLSEFAADHSNELDFRLLTGNLLLDYPRPQFRPLLDKLVREQPPGWRHFDAKDIEEAYQGTLGTPRHEQANEPWRFYMPEQIEQRQQRWQEEDERGQRRETENARLADEIDADFPGVYACSEPYVRNTPRVGRNDPCPCGSGKKYKKCCLAEAQW